MSGRDFVIDVIDKYRELPCLWQVSSDDYRDKAKRSSAMDQLLVLFKTKDPAANKETVQKKINSLRSCFRKEHNKVKASQKSGSGQYEVHVPKLWYYDHMLFLEDQDIPRRSQSVDSILDAMPFGYEIENFEENPADTDDSQSTSSSVPSRPSTSGFKRPKSKADQVLEKIAKRMDERRNDSQQQITQPYDSFGDYVAEKLRSMPRAMVPISQKLISDVLFYGEMEKLDMSSGITITTKETSQGTARTNENPC
ncbi:uncharacterized protein LOC110831041 isoform X2 [Zootermopsis nevadensis]|uniref:uncharacterized protein LOC110831041 isoform X1 n=1 Tax=Zootermopsis nevadensis TaxID=136037 RepID=UPI000B8E4531|nr:uncharacterized protein LOC110831041 isoform X1 [Zootermopsis nevadensis]XP_021922280.1 uncharacterized protein LOC110831041 isoform X2 [Zootermopsis nevadensis]